jgi:hypothetical protein
MDNRKIRASFLAVIASVLAVGAKKKAIIAR